MLMVIQDTLARLDRDDGTDPLRGFPVEAAFSSQGGREPATCWGLLPAVDGEHDFLSWCGPKNTIPLATTFITIFQLPHGF